MIPDHVRAHLSLDPCLAPLVANIELPQHTGDTDVYAHLVRTIVYQQLSGKAAATIHGRFLALFPEGYPQPQLVAALEPAELRAVGLSQQKASYIQNIAHHFLTHDLFDHHWADEPDEQVLALLTPIKGVGRWTVEMLLMFTLQRPDVFPTDDLGIQLAMRDLYGLTGKGRELSAQMMATAEAWRPYRTYACRYLWRWKDGN